tara:strand:+ start:1331 stop:1576 length:246 start_codon:yes stop_codon:yes gene_type:complete
MAGAKPKYCVGQRISHRLFHYHGVIVGVDTCFQGTDDWYEQVAQSRPPKDRPWYHVQVYSFPNRQTYVAEQNLRLDPTTNN